MGLNMINISDSDLDAFQNLFFGLADIHIMFNTTYYCENMCPHCHYSCSPEHGLNNFMPEQDIYAVLQTLHDFRFKVRDVCFSGGELTSVESVNPGYVKRIVKKSLDYGFGTEIMTNGMFVNKSYANNVLSDMADLYKTYYQPDNELFNIRMSFDQYHKDCVPNAHKLVSELDARLDNPTNIKYPFWLAGFNHDPNFRDNFNMNPKNVLVENKLLWDLDEIGRAKENKLPNCRDTKAEFEKGCGGDKLKELLFTPLVFGADQQPTIIMIFDCYGNAELADVHNPDNFHRFTTKYKKQNGEYKILPEIHSELGAKLVNHIYGNEK